jgi:hypothetical protein
VRPIDERSFTYVVKIWEERRDVAGADRTWRGSVDNVQTGDRQYFGTLLELSDYLQRESGMATISRWRDGPRPNARAPQED